MRRHLGMPKPASSLSFLAALLLLPLTTGCGPGEDSPEVIKERQARAAAIREDETKDASTVKSRTGKKQAVTKNIKGKIGGIPE